MEVPFIRLGPGQQARLAWQVLGKAGPVPNPRNIRYVPADALPGLQGTMETITLGPDGAAAALAGLNLMASTGALAFSAAALGELRQMRSELQGALKTLHSVGDRLARLEAQMTRIDIRTSEDALRHALEHALRRATQSDGIWLEPIGSLLADLTNLLEAIPGFGLFEPIALRLTTDVRDNLSDVTELLRGLRQSLIVNHNRVKAVAAHEFIASSDVQDYVAAGSGFGHASTVLTLSAARSTLRAFSSSLGEDIKKAFFWAGDEGREKYSARVVDELRTIERAAALTDPCSFALARALEHDLATDFNRIGVDTVLDWALAHVEPDNPKHMRRIKQKYQAVTDKIESDFSRVEAYKRWWLWETDAGLLHRALSEIRHLHEGYSKAYPTLHLPSAATDTGASFVLVDQAL